MTLRAFKYLSPFIIYAGSFRALNVTGFEVWLPLIYAFAVIPLIELLLKPDASNLSAAEEELARKNPYYDVLLYAVVVLQYLALYMFLRGLTYDHLSTADIAGRISVMGLLCGVFGINVGHELGHRVNRFEQTLAQALLLTSLYMHFFIEHNKGHHKRVATPEDPSSARFGEAVYPFYFRTIFFSYLSAWDIANKDTRKGGHAAFSLFNPMIIFQLIQAALIAGTVLYFGWLTAVYFLCAATIGILLLETVNYIEHYGLQRKAGKSGQYERAMPQHSWNSDHIIGRLMLFELSRHSDHHYLASRKYQVLRHFDDSPQMPTGYPGMMLLSMFPPAWFYVMNRKIRKMQSATIAESSSE